MVKILGDAPEATKQIVCRNCATLLEYTQSEVLQYRGKDMSGGADGRDWIDCPKCDAQVTIKSW